MVDENSSFLQGDSTLTQQQAVTGAHLTFQDVEFVVKNRKILKKVSGEMRPGELCAIMGPSGAGKSTLLNVLAGRMNNVGKIAGKILVNGKPIDPVTFRTSIAYVMQDDALFATQTPREALTFSAALRLPSTISKEERKALVENTLQMLGLMKCANTYVGSIMIKGISGGERKRTAIGVELISAPRILFLDEPTSGLDSFAAFKVVEILGQLAKRNTNIVCTIHQPSSEVFDLFDKAILIADGRLVYNGAVPKLVPYFASLGHVCKPNFNPADFVMFLVQQCSQKEITAMADAWEEEAKKVDVVSQAPPIEDTNIKKSSSRSTTASVWTQLSYLGLREGRNVIRDKGALGARFGISIFLNLIVGLVFMDAGRWTSSETPTVELVQTWLNNHFGALVQVAISAMFGLSQPLLLSFPLERPVFMREHATGTYKAWPYFFSKLFVEVPMAIAQSAVIFLVTYWLIGFQGNFAYLTLAVALLGLTAASTSLLLASAVSNVQVAIELSPLVFVPQLLFAGFFISITAIPIFLRWAQYVCSLKYGINLVMITEFSTLPEGFPPASADLYYDAVLGCSGAEIDAASRTCMVTPSPLALFPRVDMRADQKWVYFGILIAVFIAFRIIACLILSCKSRS